ncbi:fungal hydrophobin-domain-containing protein [Panaeolus papilionaceus]|nr:fungal hydrophobin-domain-containing protein [Panaeolus papilionaceus]
MKFTHTIATVALALPILAGATELEARDTCSTGPIQCCQTVQSSQTTGLSQVLAGAGLLGISINAIIGSIGGLVGLSCLPLSVVAVGGNSCSTQPVCCTDNFMGGIVQAGCTPINV